MNPRASVQDADEGALSLTRRGPRRGSRFDEVSEDEDDFEGMAVGMRGKSRGKSVVNTNNHYTLHLPDGYAGKAKGSEAPYVLLGCVSFLFF